MYFIYLFQKSDEYWIISNIGLFRCPKWISGEILAHIFNKFAMFNPQSGKFTPLTITSK